MFEKLLTKGTIHSSGLKHSEKCVPIVYRSVLTFTQEWEVCVFQTKLYVFFSDVVK